MGTTRRQRRFLYGGAASILAHALVAVLLWRARSTVDLRPVPPPKPKAPAIEIALRERPAAKPFVPKAKATPDRAPPKIKTAEKTRKPAPVAAPKRLLPRELQADADRRSATPPSKVAAVPTVAAPKTEAPAAGQSGGNAAPAGDPGLERWSSAWRAKEGLALPEGPARHGGGLATSLPGDQLGAALGIAPAQPDELPRAEVIGPESDAVIRKRVAGRIDGFAQSFNAHERAAVPDVYWRNLRDEMAKGFEVPYEVLDQGGRGGGRMAAVAEQYGRDLGSYGKTGNPFAGEAGAPGSPLSLQQDVARQQLAGRGLSETALGQVEMLTRGLRTASSQHLIARILISQREDGTLADVALVDGSGNPVYDRLALQQAKAMAKKKLETLGPLPAVGRRTLWAFDTDFSVMPPLPIAGCALDAYFIPRDCFYPLKKTARTRINLEAIY